MKRAVSISPGNSKHDKSVKINLGGEDGCLGLKPALIIL